MSLNPDNISKFWKELKRRRVIRVTTMYAATAFILMEASDMMFPRLGLPDWTVTFLIVLLIAGLPVAIILSWIFDVTPEGLQKTTPLQEQPVAEEKVNRKKRGLRAGDAVIGILLIVVALLIYPKIFKPDRIEYFRQQGEISLAVMPFQNLTGDPEHDFWQVMVQDILISSLSIADELTVRQTQSTINAIQGSNLQNFASISPSMARNVSQKLDAAVFVHGSISQAGERIRINARLIDAETGEVFQPFIAEGEAAEIFSLADNLSTRIRDFLVITVLKKDFSPEIQRYLGTSSSAEAMRYFIEGMEDFAILEYRTAITHFQMAVETDSGFVVPQLYISVAYGNMGDHEMGKEWCMKAYTKFKNEEGITDITRYMLEWLYAYYYGTPREEILFLRKVLSVDEQQPTIYYLIGLTYSKLMEYENAIPEYKRSLEIWDRWSIRPRWAYSYSNLAIDYHHTGRFREEKKLLKRAEKDFPGDPVLLRQELVLALSRENDKKAGELLERYTTYMRSVSSSEASLQNALAGIYADAGLTDRAEELYLDLVRALPEGSTAARYLNNAAYFLIENDRHLDDALDMIGRALELDPGYYRYLYTKGWGFYKAGRTREALELIEQAWESRPIYDHEIYLHLQEVRNTVAAMGQ